MFNWLKKRSKPLGGASGDAPKLPIVRPSFEASDAGKRIVLSIGLIQQKRYDEAKTHLRRAILLEPGNANGFYLLGKIAHEQGDTQVGIENYQEALVIKPAFEAAITDLAALYRDCGKADAAKQTLLAGLTKFPDSAQLHYRLGLLHAEARELERAFDCYGKALALDPLFAEAHWYYGEALQQRGDLTAAAASVERALACRPDFLAAHSTLLWLSSFQSGAPAGSYLSEARRYGEKVRARADSFDRWPLSLVRKAEGRVLRVGLVSGDLRTHPIGLFLEGVLANLNFSRIELMAYSINPQDDSLTERIKGRFVQWTPITQMSDEEAAHKIHADGIDILIDLAGHSANNRLPVFAWKPAPVQVSWLGYLASTGVPGMDYVLADPISVPEDCRDQFTEQVWHLPETFNCFTPPGEHLKLAVAAPPALRNGHVTFGCFQRTNKLSDATLTLWGRIFQALPEAMLFLRNQGINGNEECDRLRIKFDQFGIRPERVMLAGKIQDRESHLATYGEVDIVLDTFPYPGTTTTCEALWMGVPTVTLQGETMLGRVGASLLTCAGLREWVAWSEDEYVELAVRYAKDIEGLARLRAGLREQVAATPLFDAKRFAPQLEDALFAIWRRKMLADDGVTLV